VFIIYRSKICDTAQIHHQQSNPHVPLCKTDTYIMTLCTVMPASADVRLDLDDKG